MSAALGELGADDGIPPVQGLVFVKWGLAGLAPSPLVGEGRGGGYATSRTSTPTLVSSGESKCLDAPPPTPTLPHKGGGSQTWGEKLDKQHIRLVDCQLVTVAYADHQRAASPPLTEVLAYVLSRRPGPLLLDTWAKDGPTLLDHLSVAEVVHLCRSCRKQGVPIALAGSLGLDAIRQLRHAEPDWFAVRSAARPVGEGLGH